MNRRSFLHVLVGFASAGLSRLLRAPTWYERVFTGEATSRAFTPATLPAEFYDITFATMLIQPAPMFFNSMLEMRAALGDNPSFRVERTAHEIMKHEKLRHRLGKRAKPPTAEEVVARARRLEPAASSTRPRRRDGRRRCRPPRSTT